MWRANDGTFQFAQDATFCVETGNSGQDFSLQSMNYPTQYIRHCDYAVYIASDGGSNAWDSAASWTDDTTWNVASPRA